MTTTVAIDAHSAAILVVLQATAIEADRGEKPEGTGWQGAEGNSAFVPYLVLHTISANLTGPVADADADLDGIWQVTAVGANQTQCEQAADVARAALRAGTIAITGRAVTRVHCQPSGARRDDTVNPSVWISTDLFRIHTSPSP